MTGCGTEDGPERIPSDVLAEANLQYYWTLPLDLGEDEQIDKVILLDENLYCLTNQYRLIAVDAARGLLKWYRTVAEPGDTVFRPCHADEAPLPREVVGLSGMLDDVDLGAVEPVDIVLVNTLSTLKVYDREDGRQYRDITLDFAANAGGSSDGVYFYVGSTRGDYYAVRLPEAVNEWWLAAEGMISTPVEHFGGRVYVADTAGTLTAAETGIRGKEIWHRPMTGGVLAAMHVDRRGVFVPCMDHRLYAFDPLAGQKLWDHPFITRKPLRDPVQVGERTVYQFSAGDKFYAINLTSGAARWTRDEGRTVLAEFDGNTYLLNADLNLLVVDEMLGDVKTSVPMTGWDLFAANTTAPAVYVATRDGRIACIRTQEASHLTEDMLRE
jgi:outer membrane protein assembly factor BamB